MDILRSSRAGRPLRAAVAALVCLGVLLASGTSAVAAGSGAGGTRAGADGAVTSAQGYFLVGADGSVYPMGGAPDDGSLIGTSLARPIVAAATPPNGLGYWLAGADGGIFCFGAGAQFFGSLPALPPADQPGLPVVSLVPSVDGGGYWEVTSGGDVYSFGDAPFLGSTGAITLAQPVVSAASTPDGQGYWMVARDGGVFAFGDAQYFGSVAGLPAVERPRQPVVALVPTADGQGYWEITSGGAVYSFGDAPYLGSTGGLGLPAPVVSAAPTADGGGYWLAGADGSVYPFGDAPDDGSLTGIHLSSPIVALVPTAALAGVDATQPQSLPPPTQVEVLSDSTAPGVVGSSYQDQLYATGGTAPYTWSVSQGSLPPGVTLQSSGLLTGTPTTAGSYSFTVTATDSTTPTPLTATASLALVTGTSSLESGTSPNWAGYIDYGGPFAGVTGTFTVPSLDTYDPGIDAQWVGIGGALEAVVPIQAGVEEVSDGNGGPEEIGAWWEDPSTDGEQVVKLDVHPGDEITVTIAQQGAGQWSIVLVDDTQPAESFSTTVAYAGPADAAEWVVEAPYIDAPGIYTGEAPLTPYSPPIAFTQLAETGTVSAQAAVAMDDTADSALGLPYGGQATPSSLAAGGFAVEYGDTAPPAP